MAGWHDPRFGQWHTRDRWAPTRMTNKNRSHARAEWMEKATAQKHQMVAMLLLSPL
jgi:hypothetical protein